MDSEKQAYYAPVPQRVNKFKVFVCSLLACYVVYGSVLKYGQSDLKIQKVSDNGVDWQPCGDLLCATLMVPMNHLNPNSKMIGVAMNKYPAKIQPAQKTMLVNPGGPGGSGKHMVQGAGPMFDVIFEGKVDIIGFDPRAVGDTNPLKCYGPSQIPLFGDSMKVFGQSFIPKNASIEQIKVFDSYIELSAELCALNTGEFLEYTSTANVARDMDLIRKALGMEKMDYWGFSYGTFLGATYANMFPENVGNMIIDGIVNPTDFSGDIFDFLKGDLRETTSVLKSLGDECDKTPNCVLYEKGTYSLLRILKVINDLKSTPLLVMDSVIPGILTSETVEQILFSSLYRSVTWPQFTKGIKSAEKGNGKELYELGIDTKSVQCPGTNVNDMSANSAILCADTAPSSSQYSLEDWIDLSKKYSDELSPLAAHQWASEFLPCRHWKRFENQERYAGPWNASFAHPLLLVGNTFDPVTPLISAQETQELMKRSDKEINSVLLTQDGHGHCSLAQPSKCTVGYIKDYMLNGNLPNENTVCVSDTVLFPSELNAQVNDPILEAMLKINKFIAKK